MATETIQQKVARLESENAAMATKLANRAHLSLKVSEKGAVSLYGIRRFPVTFYKSEWTRIIGHVPAIQAFIDANVDKLSVKASE
jgi:hypothetical protein